MGGGNVGSLVVVEEVVMGVKSGVKWDAAGDCGEWWMNGRSEVDVAGAAALGLGLDGMADDWFLLRFE